MSEIKLFNLADGTATEIAGSADGLEKSLQTLFENNLETLLGIRFIATEHSTGDIHRGRIDSLGIDENGCPVIIEYKRAVSENVVSQGLYYLDWLMDHQADFTLLILERFGKDVADTIDWSGPRLVCVAADFTKFDEHAIRQINRNIDLVRYKRFGSELLALELATSVSSTGATVTSVAGTKASSGYKGFADYLAMLDEQQRDLYEDIRAFINGLGDDVIEKQLKTCVSFRRIKNFASLVVTSKNVTVYLHLDPTTVDINDDFMRDMRNTGHWGTGDLEVWIKDGERFLKAQPLIVRAYEGT